MTVQTIWPLLLLMPLGAWCAREWRHSARRLGLFLTTLAVACICIALARPQWRIQETYTAVALLSDASASIPESQRSQQQAYVENARDAASGNTMRTLEFGLYPVGALEDAEAARSTNLEAALSNALSALPPDRIPRLVVLSDGLANEGAVERAVFHARNLGVPVDTISLGGREEPELHISGVQVPPRAFAGERFPVEFQVECPTPANAQLELRAEGRLIGSQALRLSPGSTTVRARARIVSPGSTLIEGVLAAGEGGDVRFSRAIAIERPRALLVSGDTPTQNEPLIGVMRTAGFDLEVTQGPSALRTLDRSDWDLIVVSNVDFESWAEDTKENVARFVREGGGILLVAGERNLYREVSDVDSDPLRAMLPATLAPPRTPEGTAVVLVVDKSSSMEGKKMQLARQSALGVVENLREIDSVGVLAFDNSFEWAAPLQRNDNPAATQHLISGIVADGGTQIAPALAEAFLQIQPQDAVYKHILLLTDGISEEGDSIALAREAASNEVTISTIGLGQDVNRSYLERVARSAEGQSYFLIDISALEQIVLKDVMEHTGTSVTEREFIPVAEKDFEILEGLDLAEPGPLLGWVKFEAKGAAETVMLAGEEDPLFVRWQHGLGRAAVFTSDAKDRWATNWVAWNGFDTFWANALRDVLPRSAAAEVETDFDSTTDEVVVRYTHAQEAADTSPPAVFAIGPSGYRQVATPKPVQGGYEARFPARGLHGMFRIRPEESSRAFPETAHYRENSELLRYGSDSELLASIASATGGRTNPAPEQVFARDGRSVARNMHLWPLLLALAVLLNLVELLARKGWLPILGRWA